VRSEETLQLAMGWAYLYICLVFSIHNLKILSAECHDFDPEDPMAFENRNSRKILGSFTK
jgi:hypothetical protein